MLGVNRVTRRTVGMQFSLNVSWLLMISLVLFILLPVTVMAQDSPDNNQVNDLEDSVHKPMLRGLQKLDWIVIALYGAGMLGIGWFYSRKQTSTEEYFLGNRSMGSFVVGVSIYATLLSTISYLSYPGEMIKHGPVILCGLAAIPIIYVIVGYALIPAFMRSKITSGYELLESRLGISVRLLGSVIFILTRLVWMALLIYLAAKFLVVMLGWPETTIPFVVIIAGLIAVAYTAMGGLRTVVITDVVQFFILMAGAVITIILISVQTGGVEQWWPREWASNWDSQPFFSFDPHVRVTVVGSMLSFLAWWVCTAGSDQVAIQRYLATRNAKVARRAFLFNNIADISITLLLCLVGFALLGFFQINPQHIPQGKNLISDADFLFPHYIANLLPVGFAGLVVAGMFAAAMSSLDSGINSIVTVFTVDFYKRFSRRKDTELHSVRMAKYLVMGIGIAVVLLSSLMDKVPGNIFEVTNKTNGLFVGPLFGLFFMALFVPFATSFGTIMGAVYGFTTAVLIAYWDVITGQPGLSFQWIIVVSLLAHIGVGSLLSLLPTKAKKPLSLIAYSGMAITVLVIIVCLLIN